MKQKLFRFAALSTIYIRYGERAVAHRVVASPATDRTGHPTRINKIDLFIYRACGKARLNQVLITVTVYV